MYGYLPKLSIGFVCLGGTHESGKQRVTIPGCGCKFGVKLAGYVPGMIRHFNDLYQRIILGATRDTQPGTFEALHIGIIHFVTMAVTFDAIQRA